MDSNDYYGAESWRDRHRRKRIIEDFRRKHHFKERFSPRRHDEYFCDEDESRGIVKKIRNSLNPDRRKTHHIVENVEYAENVSSDSDISDLYAPSTSKRHDRRQDYSNYEEFGYMSRGESSRGKPSDSRIRFNRGHKSSSFNDYELPRRHYSEEGPQYRRHVEEEDYRPPPRPKYPPRYDRRDWRPSSKGHSRRVVENSTRQSFEGLPGRSRSSRDRRTDPAGPSIKRRSSHDEAHLFDDLYASFIDSKERVVLSAKEKSEKRPSRPDKEDGEIVPKGDGESDLSVSESDISSDSFEVLDETEESTKEGAVCEDPKNDGQFKKPLPITEEPEASQKTEATFSATYIRQNCKLKFLDSKFLTHLSEMHPTSALHELCTRLDWPPPNLTTAFECGPKPGRMFIFKAVVNGDVYQPAVAVDNKKLAKANAAWFALQELGFVQKDLSDPL